MENNKPIMVMSFEEWKEDPINENGTYVDYMHEVVFPAGPQEDIFDSAIQEFEKLYIDIKNVVWKREFVKTLISVIKELKNSKKDEITKLNFLGKILDEAGNSLSKSKEVIEIKLEPKKEKKDITYNAAGEPLPWEAELDKDK